MLKFSGWAYPKSDFYAEMTPQQHAPLVFAMSGRTQTRQQIVNVARQRLRQAPFTGKRDVPNNALRTCRMRRAKVKTPTWTDGGLPTPCRVRSILCRFSEFRTSQCLTQFAAIFLDPRTKASTVANNIKFRLMPLNQTYKIRLRSGRTGEP